MRPGIPTLGYPTKTDAIVEMMLAGLDRAEIAAKVAVSPHYVNAVIAAAKRKPRYQVRLDDRAALDLLSPLFGREVLQALEPHAETRRMTLARLCAAIIETVAQDDMVDAVLDDGGEVQ